MTDTTAAYPDVVLHDVVLSVTIDIPRWVVERVAEVGIVPLGWAQSTIATLVFDALNDPVFVATELQAIKDKVAAAAADRANIGTISNKLIEEGDSVA